MIKRKLNIAVTGCGYWGKNLVRNFHDLGVLNTICDSDAARLKFAKENYPDVHVHESSFMDEIYSTGSCLLIWTVSNKF